MSIELSRVCEKGSEGHHGREKVREGHRGCQTIENKKRPKSSRQLRNFSVKFFTENHVFSSPAVSDLQAIRLSFRASKTSCNRATNYSGNSTRRGIGQTGAILNTFILVVQLVSSGGDKDRKDRGFFMESQRLIRPTTLEDLKDLHVF